MELPASKFNVQVIEYFTNILVFSIVPRKIQHDTECAEAGPFELLVQFVFTSWGDCWSYVEQIILLKETLPGNLLVGLLSWAKHLNH